MRLKDILPDDIISGKIIRQCHICGRTLIAGDRKSAEAQETFIVLHNIDRELLICKACIGKSQELMEACLVELMVSQAIVVQDNFAEKLKAFFDR